MSTGKTKVKVGIRDLSGTDINPATSDKQDTINTALSKLIGFEIPAYDYLSFSYTDGNLTGIIYKTGGSGGTTVATLTLGYDGSDNLTSITKI